MFVLLSDTHSTEPPQLSQHLRADIADADLVAHAGDFTSEAALDEFESLASNLVAVEGNRESAAVSEQLPEQQVFEQSGARFLLVHGHRHSQTSLSLLGRQEKADVAIAGHTHRASVDHIGELLVVNPGSHADPRGGQPTYGLGRQVEDGLEIEIRTVGGRVCDSVVVPVGDP